MCLYVNIYALYCMACTALRESYNNSNNSHCDHEIEFYMKFNFVHLPLKQNWEDECATQCKSLLYTELEQRLFIQSRYTFSRC